MSGCHHHCVAKIVKWVFSAEPCRTFSKKEILMHTCMFACSGCGRRPAPMSVDNSKGMCPTLSKASRAYHLNILGFLSFDPEAEHLSRDLSFRSGPKI